MATLQNAQIDQSFGALLKTDDNGNITATPKAITDGAGNATNMQMSNTETKFSSGTVDFTGATVIGAGGAAGLESGTGSDSMQSAASLTTNAADASGAGAVALGNGATSGGPKSVAIGDGATQGANDGIAIGADANSASNGTAIGPFATTTGNQGMAIGHTANANGNGTACGRRTDATGGNSFAGGNGAQATSINSIAIGNAASASGTESMAYGDQAQATQTSAAAFGQYAEATATYAIAFGRTAAASGDGAVAFGQQTSAAQAGAVAMGRQVTADTADTTHVRALKIVAPDGAALGGNGITMLSPDGTASEVTVTNNSELAINGTAIGGGYTLKTTTQITNSVTGADETLISMLIPANTFAAGDMAEVYVHCAMDFTGGGTNYFNVHFGPNTTSTLCQLGQGGFTTGVSGVTTKRTLAVHVADGTGQGSSVPNIDANRDASSVPNGTYQFPDNNVVALDWTSDVYLNIGVYVDNAGSSATLMSAFVKKV